MDEAAAAVAKLAADALTAAGVPFRLQEAGSLFSVFLGVEHAGHGTSARPGPSPRPAYAAFFHAMLDGGVYLPPSPFEAWFLSAAHDDEAIEPDRRRAARRGPRRGHRTGLTAGLALGRTARALHRGPWFIRGNFSVFPAHLPACHI